MPLDRFPDGSDYLCEIVTDTPVNRVLRFTFPDGRVRVIPIGDHPDTKEFRDSVADAIRHNRRYMRGQLLPPPPGQSAKPFDTN